MIREKIQQNYDKILYMLLFLIYHLKILDFQDVLIKENINETIKNLEKQLIRKEDIPINQALVFTDNFVPTEIYTATMLERSLH